MSCDSSIAPTILGIAVVLATILGPILAVQIQKSLEKSRTLKLRQTQIFRTFMTLRLALTVENVQAFNAVPVEFYGEDTIIEAWRAYLAHMGVPSSSTGWSDKRIDLFFDMLQKMAVYLGYDFNFVQLKTDFYSPQGHMAMSNDQETIRRGLAEVFAGTKSVPMDVKGFPADAELNALLKKWLEKQLGI